MASDYTDGLAEKTVELVMNYLVEAYNNGDNKIAREKCTTANPRVPLVTKMKQIF